MIGAPVEDFVGFRAVGHHGVLGVVVDDRGDGDMSDHGGLVIRGGASSALIFLVDRALVRSVDLDGCRLELDVDLSDFVPALREDGTVELRLDG